MGEGIVGGVGAAGLNPNAVVRHTFDATGSGTFPIVFGNFWDGYLIVDKQGVRILRDPFTAKPHVLFDTAKRVGGDVVNFDAIKLLKCAS